MIQSYFSLKNKINFLKDHFRISECAWLVGQYCKGTICRMVGPRDLVCSFWNVSSSLVPAHQVHQAQLGLVWARILSQDLSLQEQEHNREELLLSLALPVSGDLQATKPLGWQFPMQQSYFFTAVLLRSALDMRIYKTNIEKQNKSHLKHFYFFKKNMQTSC